MDDLPEFKILRLPGMGALDKTAAETTRKTLREDPVAVLWLEVRREDIDGRHGYFPEWAGNQYAFRLLEEFEEIGPRVEMTFEGYDEDPREVFQIPEVQRFCCGFLGRTIVRFYPKTDQIGFHRGRFGAWEGKILPLLSTQDKLVEGPRPFRENEQYGTRLRIFGCAEQAFPDPILKWEIEADTVWAANAGPAMVMVDSLIKHSDLSGMCGVGQTRRDRDVELLKPNELSQLTKPR